MNGGRKEEGRTTSNSSVRAGSGGAIEEWEIQFPLEDHDYPPCIVFEQFGIFVDHNNIRP